MTEQFSYLDTNVFLQAMARNTVMQSIHLLTSFSRLKRGYSSSMRRFTLSIEGKLFPIEYITTQFQDRDYKIIIDGRDHIAVRDYGNVCILVYVKFTIEDNTVRVIAYGDATIVDEVESWFKSSFDSTGSLINTATDLDDRGNLIFSSNYMKKGVTTTAYDSFYPWLSVGLDEYFKAFMESEESILVLFGPPGTGKSTFLRALISSGNYKAHLAYNKEVVESPKLINYFYASPSDILAYEDIDNYLKSREDGNKLMSTILNSADGVVKHKNKKIVFSTNLTSIDRIDPALLRVGRCFDILEFRALTPDEAQKIAEDVGSEQKDWSLKAKWTLAQVLAKENVAQQTMNRFAKKVGFGR